MCKELLPPHQLHTVKYNGKHSFMQLLLNLRIKCYENGERWDDQWDEVCHTGMVWNDYFEMKLRWRVSMTHWF